MSQSEIRSLTGLRGIAACFVVVYHYHLSDHLTGWRYSFIHHGYMSVDLFFILSGFVMAMLYRPVFNAGFNRYAYFRFLGRRVARVYPLFATITLITFAYYRLRPQYQPVGTSSSVGALVANLATINAWGISHSVVGQGWSISTEFAAYFLFPILAFLSMRTRPANAALFGLACAALLTCLAEVPVSITHILKFVGPLDTARPPNYGPLARCLLEFSLGLLSNRIFVSKFAERWLRSKAAILLALAILVLLAIPGSDILIALAFPFFVICVARDDNAVARALGHPVAHWLGVLSYSIYLTHHLPALFLWHIEAVLPPIYKAHASLSIALKAAITLLFAVISYNVIEKPGRKILRRVFEPGREPSEEGSPNLAAP